MISKMKDRKWIGVCESIGESDPIHIEVSKTGLNGDTMYGDYI